jgi:hypothetical protein
MTGWLLNTFPSWLLGFLIVALLVVFTLIVSRIVKARAEREPGEGHNDVTGLMFTNVGVIYALLLAFVVVSTWESISAADGIVTQEAATVQALYRDSVSLGEPTAGRVGPLVIAYAEAVVNKEWPELAYGRGSEAADDALDAVFPALTAFEPKTPREQVIFAAAFAELNHASEQRFARLHEAEAALPGMFWLALIFGAMLTQVTGTLLHMRDRRLHEALNVSMAVISGLLIFLVLALDNPFAGDLSVPPDAFVRALGEMRHLR